MRPTRRLIVLVLAGAPLWLAALMPLGWTAGAIYYLGLLLVCVEEWLSLPRPEQIGVARTLPPRFSLGDLHTISLRLVSQARRPLRLRIRDELADGLEAVDPPEAGLLAAGGQATVSMTVRAVRRGAHRFGEVLLLASHGLGLVARQYRCCPADQVAKVYPRFRGVDDYKLLAIIDQRDEVVRRPRAVRGQGTDFESLRTYVAGEDLRNVSWKATARRGSLISRNMQVERNQQLAVLLDVGRLMGEKVGEQAKVEHAMNAAVMLAYVAQTRGDGFGTICFSNRIESFTPPIRGLSIMPRTLECLYNVHVRPVESDYWQVIAEAMAMLRRRSLVVMLTDVLDASGSAGLINNLAKAARRHLVLCVAMVEPAVRQVAISPPANAEQAWRQAAACDLLRRRRLALEHMRARGIQVLQTDPQRLSIHLVQRYLEIRQAGLL